MGLTREGGEAQGDTRKADKRGRCIYWLACLALLCGWFSHYFCALMKREGGVGFKARHPLLTSRCEAGIAYRNIMATRIYIGSNIISEKWVIYRKNDGILMPFSSAMAFTMKLGPFPM